MTYRTAKVIYPADMAEPLNGWYQNIPIAGGTAVGSYGGPTSVLANPGWRFFQLRGYVAVTNTSGNAGADFVDVSQVIIPSPYKNDATRQNITGMVVSGNTERPAYVYRASISVASGWGDGRVAEDGIITENATQVIGFGPGTATAPESFSGVVQAANLTAVSNNIPAGSGALGTNPFQTATTLTTPMLYKEYTSGQEFRVYAKAQTNSTSTAGGWAITDSDFVAGNIGYIIVEVCFIQPDVPVNYNDIEQYLPYKTESLLPGQQYN